MKILILIFLSFLFLNPSGLSAQILKRVKDKVVNKGKGEVNEAKYDAKTKARTGVRIPESRVSTRTTAPVSPLARVAQTKAVARSCMAPAVPGHAACGKLDSITPRSAPTPFVPSEVEGQVRAQPRTFSAGHLGFARRRNPSTSAYGRSLS